MTRKTLLFLLFLHPLSLHAAWSDWWFTQDQQAQKLFDAGKTKLAAKRFQNKNWRGVSHYRSGNYKEALRQFSNTERKLTTQARADNLYNQGNALAHLGKYEKALTAYNGAIALDNSNQDARQNKKIIEDLIKKDKQQKSKSSKQNQDKNQTSSKKQDSNNKQSKKNNDPAKSKDKQANNKRGDRKQERDKQSSNSRNDKPASSQENKAGSQRGPESKQHSYDNAPGMEQAQAKQAKPAKSAKEKEASQAQMQRLKRVPDNPGGLLQQKFMRDYLKRHPASAW